MNKKRKLGRGLDALLGMRKNEEGATLSTEDQARLPIAKPAEAIKDGELVRLPIDLVIRGKYQPRREFAQEALEELAASIKRHGVMQPIVVRPVGEGRYEIIAGERRWRATQLAGLDIVPAVVREVADDEAVVLALMENIQREDLNPVEKAAALQRLVDEFQLTHEQVADAVGKSRSTVTNLLRLMTLGEDIRQLLREGRLDMGHARALLTLPPEKQREAVNTIVNKNLSVRQTESLANQLRQNKAGENKSRPVPESSSDIRRLETDLSEKLGAPVALMHTAKGKGKLVIRYNSLDELDGILSHIR